MDRIWVGTLDNLYPTAGNPYIGILALFIAILFLYIIGLDNNINDGCCSVGCECWIPFVLVIFAFVFGWSFCERAGERRRVEGVRVRAPLGRENAVSCACSR